MNAPPFPRNPMLGQYYGNWVWSGSRWVCSGTGIRIITTTFTASAPYTPAPGLITTVVEAIGGGGGGGGATTAMPGGSALGTIILGGGGGGSGGYSRSTLAAALVLGGVNITIGTGGLGETTGAGFAGNGQATSFGALVVANGGAGGGSNNGIATPYGALGGEAPVGIGDVAFPGTCGWSGITMATVVPGGAAAEFYILPSAQGGSSWAGGASNFLTGPQASHPGATGAANTGCGGGGAILNQIGNPGFVEPGGDGGSGVCIVTEYCWADAMDDGCGCGPTGGARVAITADPQGRGGWGYNEDGE